MCSPRFSSHAAEAKKKRSSTCCSMLLSEKCSQREPARDNFGSRHHELHPFQSTDAERKPVSTLQEVCSNLFSKVGLIDLR